MNSPSMPNYDSRRDRLLRFVHDKGFSGFLVTSPVNVTYLTGFTGESSYLLVGRDQTILVSDGRFTEQLHQECPGLPLHIRPPSIRLQKATAEVVDKLGWRQIAFEGAHVTIAEFANFKELLPSAEWKAWGDVVESMRARKDEFEIAEIRQAIAIAEQAFGRWRQSLRPEDTEKQLGDRMEMLLREEGARSSSFPTIVGMDERAAMPHAPVTGKRLEESHLLLVDWGAAGRLYKSDLTRVLPTRKISSKLEEVYAVVLKAQARALEMIRPGVKAHDVDAEARAVLEEAGFGELFSHSLGHGIGLEVHESPGLRPNSDTILQAGMVVTVEPGIYIRDWGGVRIEDDVLVSPDGCEVLTSVSRELSCLMVSV